MISKMATLILLIMGCTSLVAAELQQTLFMSWDFEEPSTSTSTWKKVGSQLSLSNDSYSGTYAAKIDTRVADWGSIQMEAPVTENSRYFFSAFVRLLTSTAAVPYERVDLRVRYLAGGTLLSTVTFGLTKFQDCCPDSYFQVSGDFLTPAGTTNVQLRLKMAASVEYLTDEARLFELTPSTDWKAEADVAISTHRMENITIRVDLPEGAEPSEYTVKVKQTSRAFAFGSAVRSAKLTASDNASLLYQQFFYENFEWAVLENDLKWRQLESQEGVFNYAPADDALDALEDHGIQSRAHAVLWDGADKNPDWVAALSGQSLLDAMWTHQNDTMSRYASRANLKHWDMNNEFLVGRFYEDASGVYDLMPDMFQRGTELDPDVELFLNEYKILNQGGMSVQAYLNLAQGLLDSGVAVAGIGIESHLNDGIDIPLIQRRLDAMATLGLPIWITELTVNEPDMATRAQGYEDVLRLYFSHPAVEGVLIWGFWDGAHYDPTAVLVEGDDFQINLAGEKFLSLLSQWKTKDERVLTDLVTSYNLSGYHGDYTVSLFHLCNAVNSTTFTLLEGQPISVDLSA